MPSLQISPIRFHLDHPAEWDELPRQLTIRGWGFFPKKGPTTGIRAFVGHQVTNATIGHHRPDVRSADGEAPNEFTGFQISTRTPSGKFEVILQLRTDNTDWNTFFRCDARSSRWRLPFALGGGNNAELLTSQLTLTPQHRPRKIRADPLPSFASPTPRLPKLSIVTPSFNQGSWLACCIQSVAAATEPGIEHLIRDGGSSDQTVAVLKAEEPHLHSWVSQSDAGQAAAIAAGFAETMGDDDDLMAWINADDHYLPGALPFVRRFFAKHPTIDVLYGNRVLINETGDEIGRWHLPPHDDDVLKLYDFVPQETLFWRRRIWNKVGGIDPTFHFALDWDLLLRFQAGGAKMLHVPRFLAAFRIHPNQKSAAQIGSFGQSEIDLLRLRTWGREVTATDLINSPVIEAYLRQSARRQLAAQIGLRPALPS